MKKILFIIFINFLLTGCDAPPLAKFKKESSGEFEQCVGVVGSVDYKYFTSSKDSNIGVIQVTMKKSEDTFLLQWLYNKSTKIRSNTPSAMEFNGEAQSLMTGSLNLVTFCM